eukprot:1924357-Pleurochrysis_carterae.AAC.1
MPLIVTSRRLMRLVESCGRLPYTVAPPAVTEVVLTFACILNDDAWMSTFAGRLTVMICPGLALAALT